MRNLLIGLAAALVVPVSPAFAADAGRWEDTFSDGLNRWEPLNEAHWSVEQVEDQAVLRLEQTGPQRPPVRRPGEYALVRGEAWSNVTLAVRARSLEPTEKKGRDIVLIFGYRDDTHFYYAHLSNDSNGTVHNVIMKVAGETRGAIHREERPEPRLTDGWHDIRVTHLADGTIEVWMDDLEQPLMTARDRDYPGGRVGIGSFDDRAEFGRVVVEGSTSKKERP